jgi:peptidoglycan-associated lipoprotein
MKHFLILLLLGACSTSTITDKTTDKTTKELPVVESRTNKTSNASTNKIEEAVIEIVKIPVKDRKDPNKLFESNSVYFDLDEYIVQEKYQSVLKKHGEFLAKNPNEFVFIEGHTDERGGKEYNLALGQRRANAVRVELMRYGATDSQIEAYSYGSEKPKALGSNEEAWSQNRRVDLYYKN